MEWIKTSEQLPKFSDEYLVVWDLKDGEHPVVTSMDFDVKSQAWSDPRGTGEPLEMSIVLLWADYPETPMKLINEIWRDSERKTPYVEPVTFDQMERLAYGQCVHGENMTRCSICNPDA